MDKNQKYKVWLMMQEADIVIIIKNGKISILKSKEDGTGEVGFPELLEVILPFQDEYIRPFIQTFINKMKTYRIFS